MILTCPSCGSRYLVNPLHLGDQGRRVKCARCHHVWFQARPAETAMPPPASGGYGGAPHPGSHGPAVGAGMGGAAPGMAPPGSEQRRYQVPSTEVRPRRSGPMAAWLLLFLVLGAGAAVAAAARDDVVRLYPPAVQVYDLVGLPVDRGVAIQAAGVTAGLAFDDLEVRLTETVDGTAVVLSGSVVNTSEQERALQPIAASLLDGDGAVLERWVIGTGRDSLAPGEQVDFSTRRNRWPDGTVSLRFGLQPPQRP